MYTIPAQRTTDARRAMTDLRVLIAGPIGAVPESRMSRRGGYSVGRMHQMIGPGRPAIFLIGRTETYGPNGWAARPGEHFRKWAQTCRPASPRSRRPSWRPETRYRLGSNLSGRAASARS